MPRLREEQITADIHYATSVCATVKERLLFPSDIWDHHHYFFRAPTVYPQDVIAQKWAPKLTLLFEELAQLFNRMEMCAIDDAKRLVREVAKKHDVTLGKLMPLIRIALTGTTVGPELWRTMACLGPMRIHDRLQAACVAWNHSHVMQKEGPV